MSLKVRVHYENGPLFRLKRIHFWNVIVRENVRKLLSAVKLFAFIHYDVSAGDFIDLEVQSTCALIEQNRMTAM